MPAKLRWCANGKHCASAPALGGPAPLSRHNSDSICFCCRERRIDAQLPSDTPSDTEPQVTYTLSEAADLLGLPRWRVEYLVTTGQLRATKRVTKLKRGRRAVRTIAEDDLRALEGAS